MAVFEKFLLGIDCDICSGHYEYEHVQSLLDCYLSAENEGWVIGEDKGEKDICPKCAKEPSTVIKEIKGLIHKHRVRNMGL